MPKHDDGSITVSVIPPTVDVPERGRSYSEVRLDQAVEILCHWQGTDRTIAVLLGWLIRLYEQNTKEG